MITRTERIQYLLISSVLVCLGWGLRGYIGGGPLGAMIPGAFIALWLCLLLGADLRRAGIVAAFGAVGIGFGGEMTYGQTLGLLRDGETLAWGLLGTVVKGGVWGLLGGAVLGVGFIQHRLPHRQLAGLLGAFLIATWLGIVLINHPKLIYFSDPVNKPRAECWAGLLFGALAILGLLRRRGLASIPWRFGLFGMAGGAAGFGIGGVLMAIGSRVEAPLRELPWWKFMEFTFGACLGLALGWCALALRDQLRDAPAGEPVKTCVPWRALATVTVFIGLSLVAWNYTAEALIERAQDIPLPGLTRPLLLVVLGYSALGAVLLLLAPRYNALAWHTAITMTFIASVIDLLDDVGPDSKVNLSAGMHWLLLFAAVMLTAALVMLWQRGSRPGLKAPLLGLIAGCMAVAFGRIMIDPTVISPDAAELAAQPAYWCRFTAALADHGIVHGIFTVTALVSVAAILHLTPSEKTSS